MKIMKSVSGMNQFLHEQSTNDEKVPYCAKLPHDGQFPTCGYTTNIMFVSLLHFSTLLIFKRSILCVCGHLHKMHFPERQFNRS